MSMGRVGGTPPTFELHHGELNFGFKLLAPPCFGEVQGFAAADVEFLSQEQVDRAAAKLLSFIEHAPEDEQEVYLALLEQARSTGDESWPTT